MTPQTKYTKQHLVCGEIRALRQPGNRLVRLKKGPVGDWALIQTMK